MFEIVQTTSSFFLYQRAEYPRDCHEVLSQCPSSRNDGVYVIKPDGYPEPFEVSCNNSLGDGGWTVIQRRKDSSINFNRTWDEYENGFGFLSHEFWLGNEKISYITNQRKYQLRMDITTESGCSFFVTYETFRISDSFSHYKLVSTGEYTGATGYDAMRYHNGEEFSTRDEDNDDYSYGSIDNLAEYYSSAWWYSYYYYCDLNRPYTGSYTIYWYNFPGGYYNIRSTEMKIRPRT
ncbi:fibrinogen-like protein A [Apostichopus japonicus]|uniref:Fibrinogen-like protein A n=1 Tax=Stichopus japonicus TaxID=307972 RepID=A0A2G8L629_STIJA|nr:fibrinogen-like protein A [Apostichopus japonicus]